MIIDKEIDEYQSNESFKTQKLHVFTAFNVDWCYVDHVEIHSRN